MDLERVFVTLRFNASEFDLWALPLLKPKSKVLDVDVFSIAKPTVMAALAHSVTATSRLGPLILSLADQKRRLHVQLDSMLMDPAFRWPFENETFDAVVVSDPRSVSQFRDVLLGDVTVSTRKALAKYFQSADVLIEAVRVLKRGGLLLTVFGEEIPGTVVAARSEFGTAFRRIDEKSPVADSGSADPAVVSPYPDPYADS